MYHTNSGIKFMVALTEGINVLLKQIGPNDET